MFTLRTTCLAAFAGLLAATAIASDTLPANDIEFELCSDEEVAVSVTDNDCCDVCCECCCTGLLGGLIQPSDHCFDDFISPMTNPVFFEDPRTLTEARLIFINHWFPTALGGSDARLIALHLRAAVTDRLSIVAAKDGFIMSDAQGPLAGVVEDGWADVSLGLKYNLLVDPCCGRIVSTGIAYELPVGSTRAQQGNGDGEFHVYLSAGQRIGCDMHWMTCSGFRLPTNRTEETTVWYWSNHIDRQIACGVYAFAEANWYHWLASGERAAFNGVQGGSLFNLGGTGVAGDDIVTGALGLKLKPNGNREIGVAYETHLTDRRGIMQDRLTMDLILRY